MADRRWIHTNHANGGVCYCVVGFDHDGFGNLILPDEETQVKYCDYNCEKQAVFTFRGRAVCRDHANSLFWNYMHRGIDTGAEFENIG